MVMLPHSGREGECREIPLFRYVTILLHKIYSHCFMTSSKHIVTPKSTPPLVKLSDWLKFHVDQHIIFLRSAPYLNKAFPLAEAHSSKTVDSRSLYLLTCVCIEMCVPKVLLKKNVYVELCLEEFQ